MQKQQQNARMAAVKAQGQRVFVSGVQGHQTLELGVAYHHRGHYIYAYPAGNPIEPVPFSTKKGINIIGTVQHLAPRYDPNAPDLVPEPSIGALSKSCHHVWDAQKEQEKQDKEELKRALGAEQAVGENAAAALQMPTIARQGSRALSELPQRAPPLSYSMSLIPTQVMSHGSSHAVSRTGSRGDSYTSLPSLTILDARSNPDDSAPYHSIIFRQTSSQSDLTSFASAEGVHGLLNVPDRGSRAATPTLHRSSSDEAHHSLPSRSTSAITAKLHRLSPRLGSSSSLAEFVAHNAHVSHSGTSSTTLPGLRHSSSPAGSYGSSPSLTTLGHDYTAAHTQAPASTFGTAPSMPSISAYAPQTFWNEHSYTPHDRALFLASSAPGSRLASVTNTPQASRPVSPTLARSLHPIASTSRLNHLLGSHRATSPLSDLVEGTSNYEARMRGFDLGSDTNSSTESIPSSVYTSRDQTPSIVMSPPYSRKKPIGTGRPRHASMTLNQTYNAANPVSSSPVLKKEVGTKVPKCALHGEGCDGVSVSETWKTQHAKETTGFKELYPVVQGAGHRVMIDWHKLLREEQGMRG